MNYMEAVQQDVNAHMRGILVDWLVEVAQEYKLVSETLFLAVNYIDRFLSCEVAPRRKLQLVGITCMLIAAKYEEIYAPQIEDFCYITDNTYSREEVIAMEQQVSNGILYGTQLYLLNVLCIKALQARQGPIVVEQCRTCMGWLTLSVQCKHTFFLQILGALSFELTVPTAKTFLRRFLKAAMPSDAPADARLEFLSSYLAELMLPEYRALQFRPSQVG